MTNKLALVVAVALGILSIVGIRLYIQRVENKIAIEGTPVQVWVATQDLKKGSKFDPENDAQEGDIPFNVAKTSLNDSHITKPSAYEGSRLVADVVPGQVLQTYHFVDIGGSNNGLKGRLRPGYRAVSIPVDAITGVSGFLKPGDRIDISTPLEFKDALGASDIKLSATRTLLKNVEILATGRIIDPDNPRAGRTPFETLTLALKPKDVNKLLHVYTKDGALHCSYKEVNDSSPPGWSTVTDDQLFREVKDEIK